MRTSSEKKNINKVLSQFISTTILSLSQVVHTSLEGKVEKFSQAKKDCPWVVEDYLWVFYCWRVFFVGSRVCLELVYVMLVSGCIVS